MKEKDLWFKPNNQTNGITVSRKKRFLWKIVDQYLFKPSPNIMSFWRVWILRIFGAKIGKKCYISQRVTIYSPWKFEIGNYSAIDDYCYIVSKVKIGDYVSIGNNCLFIAGGHDIYSRGFEATENPIIVGNGVFVGAGTYVGPGVKIKQMSVIGAHCHIVQDIEENTITTMAPIKTISCRRLKTEEYNKYRFSLIE